MALSSDDVFNTILALLIAITISIVISQIYKLTHRGVNYESSFMTSLVMLAPVVTIVMFFIQGSLVLSLGLVGSLSIIRFRTPIKDTRDMVYLFWVIAVGLGAGTFNWGIVILSSLVIIVMIILLYYLKYGKSQNNDYVLIISGQSEFNRDPIREIILKFSSDARVRSQTTNPNEWEIVFELTLKDKGRQVDDLLQSLNEIPTISNVSLLAPQLSLPV